MNMVECETVKCVNYMTRHNVQV